MWGYGEFKFGDNKEYRGEYENDKKQGYGKFYWPSGKAFEGWWGDGKQEGYGVLSQGEKRVYAWYENGNKV